MEKTDKRCLLDSFIFKMTSHIIQISITFTKRKLIYFYYYKENSYKL